MQTVQYAGEIRAYAARANRSLSTLLRESIEVGWPRVRRNLIKTNGEITPAQRLHGEVTSLLPVSDRFGYERSRMLELLETEHDMKEYAEIVSPTPVGAE